MPQNKIRTEDIVDSQITYAKIQNVSNNNLLLGRNTAGAGLIEELNAATAKAILALNNVENVALSTWTGSTNINTLGTITQGTWSGSTISIDKGGTGLNTLGTANQVLAVNSGGTALQYVTPLSGTGTSGQVSYWSGTQTQTGSQGLTYSTTENGRLYVGTPLGDGKLNLTRGAGDNLFYQNTFSTTTGNGNYWFVRKSASNTEGALVETTNTHFLGGLYYQGVNTSNAYAYGAQIIAQQLGAAGTFVPTSLIFRTYSSTAQNANQLFLSPNSNVGLSTNSPAARLHVVGSGITASGWTAQFQNSGGTSNSLMIRDDGNIGVNTNTPNARLQVHGGDTTDTGWTAQFHNVNGNSNSLMIRNDGNVGIGTSTPTSRFDVVGSVEFQNPTSAFNTPSFGSELLTTGAGTNWTGTSFATGYLHATGSTVALTSAFTPTNGQFYRIVVTTTGVTTGSTTVTFGGLTIGTLSTNTTITVDDRTSSTAALVFTPTSEFNGTVTASVRLISASLPQFIGKSLNGTVVYEERLSNSNTNIFQGVDTGRLNTTGTFNVFQGRNSGRSNTTGNNNLFQGADSGYSNITGSFNIFQGASTGYSNTTGGNNLFQGSSAGYFNTTGSFNIFQGARAGYSNTTGNANIFQGYLAGYSNTTGYYNFFQGYLAGFSNTTGNSNIIQGYEAGYSNTTGNRNVLQGYQAGRYIVAGLTGNTIINNSILIGYDSRALASGQTNQVVIGYQGRGLGSNTTVIGNSSTTQTWLGGSLTLGTQVTPAARLHTVGGGSGNTTWTAQFHNALGNSNSLMIRDDGNVGIGTNAPSSSLDVVGTVEFQNPTTDYDGATFGPQLLTDGSGSGWTGTNYTTGYTHIEGSTGIWTSNFAATSGDSYRVIVSTSGTTTGSTTITFGGFMIGILSAGVTSITIDNKASAAAGLVFTPTSEFNGTITASVRKINESLAQFTVKNSIGGTVYEQRLVYGNIFQGQNSGLFNTTGLLNIFQGSSAGYSNLTGNSNIFQGVEAGRSNTTGSNNVFQGLSAGFSNISGERNVYQGSNAGFSNVTGNRNVFQGFQAGRYIVAGLTGNSLISNSILIGYDSRALASGQTNQIVIGYEGRGLGSNTTVIGNTGTTISLIHGNVSAGETNPKNKLETSGSFGRGSLVQVNTASYTVGDNDTWIRVSTISGSVALTLPDPTAWIRREIMIIRTSGATVASASANVVKFAGAGTAILGADETSCTLVSDGTNWYVMSLG